MTTKELAEFFGKSDDTISRAAKSVGIVIKNGVKKNWTKDEVEKLATVLYDKVPEAIKDSIRFTFLKLEGQPSANAKVQSQVKMTGALGRVYLDAATRGLISKDQFQQVMGLAKSGVYMTPEDSSRALEVIKRQYPVALPVQPHGSEKTRKAMYAAGRQTQEREEQKITQDRMNIHLDFDRGSQK